MKRWQIYLLAFSATLLAVFWQELNLVYLNGLFPSKNGLLTSADEASYFGPVDHFLESGVWKNKGNSLSAYFIRTPGYGFVYLFCVLIAHTKAFFVLKIIQISCFFATIIYADKVLKLLVQRQIIRKTTLFLLAFLPCFSGFMYFTLTESITPFLLLQTVYFSLKIQQESSKKYVLFFSFSNAVLVLFRPQLILVSLFFIVFQLLQKKWKHAFLLSFSLLPLVLWNVRTLVISEQFLGIHPIYAYQNNSIFRPSHEKLTNLFRIWEHDGSRFHQTVALLSDSSQKLSVEKAVQLIPQKYRQEVKPILSDYRKLLLFQQLNFPNDQAIYAPFSGEKDFEKQLDEKRRKLISAFPVDYYVKTPFNSMRQLLLTSHLNLALFQHFWRGDTLVEIVRWMCFSLLFFTWIVLPLGLFYMKNKSIFWLHIAVLSTLSYLCFVQRMNEERYLTPFLPLVLILAASLVSELLNRRKKREEK